MSKVHVGRLSLDLCTHAAANALCFTKSLLIPKRYRQFSLFGDVSDEIDSPPEMGAPGKCSALSAKHISDEGRF